MTYTENGKEGTGGRRELDNQIKLEKRKNQTTLGEGGER